ncbi:hypothetical protein TNCV_1886401 [Trichonephila clavipes]|nr:hypothetical protein TNCV_1886401 [Trichonephila clavipes]
MIAGASAEARKHVPQARNALSKQSAGGGRKAGSLHTFIRSQRIRFFLSVFIIYQIIDNVIVIESFVFNQVCAASALRESK